jgi:hypothetical protein
MNRRKRVIMMTAEGKYVVKTDKGMAYNPKAAYVKSPGGTMRTLTNSKARVPTAIRPKATRKVRKNRGVKRGAYAVVRAGALPALFSPKAKRGPGRPRKHMVSPGGRLGLAAMYIVPRRGRPAKAKAGQGAGIDALLRSMTPR